MKLDSNTPSSKQPMIFFFKGSIHLRSVGLPCKYWISTLKLNSDGLEVAMASNPVVSSMPRVLLIFPKSRTIQTPSESDSKALGSPYVSSNKLYKHRDSKHFQHGQCLFPNREPEQNQTVLDQKMVSFPLTSRGGFAPSTSPPQDHACT